ncbi:MAG: outer membrane protein nutrient binding [Mucilaginibacter sp.]|nr:outer membrane protein nutrient binding [Mucilaginibacter sp.]
MKMLKKKYIAALLLILVAGCKKAPVNIGPQNAYSSSTYPATINQLQTVLVSCYANLRDQGIFGFNFFAKSLADAMHTTNEQYTGDLGRNEAAAENLTAGDEYAREVWTACYTGIKNCNVTIYAAGVLLKTNPSVDTKAVNLVVGQAYCLRAWYYMELECLFGQGYLKADGTNGSNMGVPLITGVPSSLAETQVARGTVKDTWALIISDLKQSATLLKGQVWPTTDAARATEWSAKGLLGKAYVYTQDWANAKTVLLDVITNSGKSLMPFATYNNAFNGANKFNSESLLELYVDPDSKGGYGVYTGNPNSSTINGLIWSPSYIGPSGNESDSKSLGYSNSFVHDQNVLRFGYPLPSYTLVANPAYTGSNPSYKNPTQVINPAYKTAALAVRANQTADPRLFVNTLQPRIDSVKVDGVNWTLVSKPGNYASAGDTHYGFSMRKYSPITYTEQGGVGNGGSTTDIWDYYLLRLADVYLLYAEASIGSGDNATGLEYLNRVKRRAYGLPIITPSAIDYKSLTDFTPAANPLNPDPVLGNNPLYYERWAELFNEGTWWFDVCRWKIGASEAAYYGTAINVTGPLTSTFVDSKSYVWPIPLSELNGNSKIKQNPGY